MSTIVSANGKRKGAVSEKTTKRVIGPEYYIYVDNVDDILYSNTKFINVKMK